MTNLFYVILSEMMDSLDKRQIKYSLKDDCYLIFKHHNKKYTLDVSSKTCIIEDETGTKICINDFKLKKHLPR